MDPQPNWHTDSVDDAGWSPVQLPARVTPDMAIYDLIPLAEWPGERVALRGWMELATEPAELWLAITIREQTAHRLAGVHVNGVRVEPSRSQVYTTFETRITETLLDLSHVARRGPNLLAVEIDAEDTRFDLDVFEISAPAP